MELLYIIYEFFLTGLFAVGGGLATIPFLQNMVVKYGWFTMDTLSTMIAVGEATPGPIGVNMATYVGFVTYGLSGAIAATLSLVAPSVIVVCIISKMLDKFKNSAYVQSFFYGLRPAVVAFIISATLGIFTMTLLNLDSFSVSGNILDLINYKSLIIYIAYLIVDKYKKLNPILIIVSCAIIGILIC